MRTSPTVHDRGLVPGRRLKKRLPSEKITGQATSILPVKNPRGAAFMSDEEAREKTRNAAGRPGGRRRGSRVPPGVEEDSLDRLPRVTPLTITLLLAFVLSAVALVGVLNLPFLGEYLEGPAALWAVRVGVVAIIVSIVVYFVLRERSNLEQAEKLLERMSWANRRLRLLLDAGRDIAGSLDMDSTVRETLGYAVRASGADAGALFMWDREAGSLRLMTASGFDADLLEMVEVAAGEGALGVMVDTVEMKVIEEPRGAAENVFEGAAEPAVEALVPLAAGGRFLGVIALGVDGDRRFDPDDLDLLDGLAELASLSVTNAELYRISRTSLEAAARQREMTARILDEMPAGVMTTDARGRLVVFNREARRITGYTPREAAEMKARPGVKLEQSPLGAISEGILEVLESRSGTREGEGLVLTKDNRLVPVGYRVNPQREGEKLLGATAVFMEEKEVSAGQPEGEGIDYQWLLRSVGSRVERLYVHPLSRLIETVKGMDTREWKRGREEVLRALEEAPGALVRLLEDVEQYLTCTACREWDAPSDHEIEPIVADVVKRVLRSPGAGQVMVSVNMADLPPVFGHERMIKTALEKVVENACAAAAEGDRRVNVSASAGEEFVRVDVQDGGPGIRAEDREMLYQPFFSTGDTNSGLGLPIARRVMQRLGGGIGMEDADRGARFFLEFPTGAHPGSTGDPGAGAGAEGGE